MYGCGGGGGGASVGEVRGGAFGEGVTAGMVYDLASLTKVVATLPMVLGLVGAGEVGLDDAVVRFLPGFGVGSGASRVGEVLVLVRASMLVVVMPSWRRPSGG
ncbi:serine hydrolase [Catenulispora yoronensis]